MITEGLHHMDCKIGMRQVEPESVDIIFTDPAYIAALWEKSYKTLANGAMRILKPGAFCVTYVPQRHLDDILDIMRRPGLRYYWTVPVLNQGATAKVHDRNVLCLHKPIFMFQKPTETLELRAPERCFADVIRGLRQKSYHAWQQDIHDPISLLSRICKKGDLVCDPFLGSGTTALAAKVMGMRYLGFEIEEETFKKALRRMEQVPIDLSFFDNEPENEDAEYCRRTIQESEGDDQS